MTSDIGPHANDSSKTRRALLRSQPTEKVQKDSGDAAAWSIGATIALLRRAQATIEKAEHRITAQNERIRLLEDLSMTDELTGLFNRRGLCMALGREIARMRRGFSDASLMVFVDIDNLTSVRDQFTDQAAQSCQKLVARILESETRAMDFAARTREGEFVMLFSGSPADVSLERTQKLAVRLNNLSLIRRGREIQISTSIGLKAFGIHDTPEDLLAKNEERMN